MDLWADATAVGGTPFYRYDFDAVRQRVAELRTALPAGVELHYAVKANPMPALIQRMAHLVDGFDVASQLELSKVLDTGMDVRRISFAGPAKRDAELAAAVAAGVTINVESPGELARIRQVEATLGRPARFAIRVNPDFRLVSSGMSMSGGSSQFGIDTEAVADILKVHGTEGLVGLHIFAGSQNLRTEALTAGATQTFALAHQLVTDLGLSLEHVNIGGGLGIPYFDGEQPVDLARYGSHLATELEQWRTHHPEVTIVIELGRYLVGEAGIYVMRVLERKESRGRTYLMTDGGLHHHLAASGNFGQVIRRNYPVSAVTATPTGQTETVDVVGPLCTPLDILGRQVVLPRCEPGDLVIVGQSGAYGPSASPLNFLGHPAPAEILRGGDGDA